MKFLNLFSILVTLFTLSSCEDVIDLDVPQGKKTLVVEGWLTNRAENDYVKLYFTSNVSGTGYTMLPGAKVVLKDNVGNTEMLNEVSPGKYLIPDMKSVDGRIYTLSIESSAGNYEATAEVKRLSMPLDSLSFRYEKKSSIYEYEGYYPLFNGQDLPGEGDFIQVRIYKDGVYLNKAGDLNLYRDDFVDGNYIGKAEMAVDRPFAKNDKVKAEVWSLTEDACLFWVDLQVQLQNAQLFASPLANTRTNVVKKSNNAVDVVGYFGASLVQGVETVVK